MRTRMDAAGLIASIVVACGGLTFSGGSPLSWISVFSLSARASEAIVARADTCGWNDAGWYDMTEEERTAWRTLGWTSQMWESEDPATQAPSSSQEWKSLSERERSAARQLGYGQNSGDNEKCVKR